MRKRIIIIFITIIVIVFVCFGIFYRDKINENIPNLTFFEKIFLNSEAILLYNELQNLELNLLKNEASYNEVLNENTSLITNGKSADFSNICNEIYEVRKKNDDSGNTIYFFDLRILDGKESNRRKIRTINGKVWGVAYIDTDFENIDNPDSIDNFVKNVNNSFKRSFNELIENEWNEAIVIDNVDYNKLLDIIRGR